MGITPQTMSSHTFDDLYDMMDANDFPALEQALNEGADINMVNKYSNTLLIEAAAEGKVEAVQVLVDCKACLDIKDEDGMTALDLAQELGNTEWKKKRPYRVC